MLTLPSLGSAFVASTRFGPALALPCAGVPVRCAVVASAAAGDGESTVSEISGKGATKAKPFAAAEPAEEAKPVAPDEPLAEQSVGAGEAAAAEKAAPKEPPLAEGVGASQAAAAEKATPEEPPKPESVRSAEATPPPVAGAAELAASEAAELAAADPAAPDEATQLMEESDLINTRWKVLVQPREDGWLKSGAFMAEFTLIEDNTVVWGGDVGGFGVGGRWTLRDETLEVRRATQFFSRSLVFSD